MPVKSQRGSAFSIFGIISSSSFRSVRKKINASSTINAANISLQYNFAENDCNFLYSGGKFRSFNAKIGNKKCKMNTQQKHTQGPGKNENLPPISYPSLHAM